MDLLEQFKSFLFSQDSKASKITVKNYISDINHFIRWYEQRLNKSFDPKLVSHDTIETFKHEISRISHDVSSEIPNTKYQILSPSSLERHLSSLRKFFAFLKIEGKIPSDPFKTILNPASETKDPWRIKDFKDYLYVHNASHLTIKNYLIDIKQFLNWAEEVIAAKEAVDLIDSNILNHVNSGLIGEYKKRLLTQGVFSPSTINRKLSSLRKYFAWAATEKLIRPFSFETSNIEPSKPEPINLPQENKQAQIAHAPEKRIEYSKFPPLRLFQKLSNAIILALDLGLINHLAVGAEAAQHLFWRLKGNSIFSAANKIRISKSISIEDIVGVKNLSKELYAPLEISTKYFPWYKKLWHTLKYRRPKWYVAYHSYAIVHYFHFAILLIFIVGLAIGFYNGFGRNQAPTQAAANLPTAPNRVLSFQGRLTDSSDNPITSPTNLRFSIYRDSVATGAAILLWQEVDQVSPDTDGIFNSVLGNTTTVCADPLAVASGTCAIPSTLFSQNNALFLGVTVEHTSELTPRQPIATVAFASNSETLQGLLPITATSAGTTNVVLALDSSGNLSIGGSATPVFQATGGQFKLSGQPLVLTTNTGSNGNVQLAPDGLGRIDLTKPLQNASLSNNISTAVGSVEVDDLFSILATSGGQSAFTINQTGAGPLISASASGANRFAVDNSGNVRVVGGQTSDFDTFAGATLGIGTLNQTGLTIGRTTTANTTLQGANYINGGVLYGLSGAVSITAGGGVNQCLLGQGSGVAPIFGACGTGVSSDLYWNQQSGTLFPNNSTVDLLIGGQSTISAKFRVVGNSPFAGTLPVASIGARTSFAALVVDNQGVGDLFTASASGLPLFTVTQTGNVIPGTNAGQDIGSATRVWRNIYGTTYFSGATQGQTATLGCVSSTLGIVTGSGTCPINNIDTFWNQTNGALYPNNSTVDLLVGGQSSASANFRVTGSSPFEGTTFAASVSGQTSFAAFVVNNDGVGDLFTASDTGKTVFALKKNGQILDTAYQTCTIKTDATGLFTCGTDNTGSGSSSPFSELSGSILANNTTEDFLLGGQSTISAKFRVVGNSPFAGTLPVASIGARTSFAALVVDQQGLGDILTGSSSGSPRFAFDNLGNLKLYGTNAVISETGANTLTFNSLSTGNIQFFNSNNTIDTSGNLIIAGDLRVNGNDILDSAGATRVTFSSNTITLGSTTTLTASGLATVTSANALNLNPQSGSSYTLDTSATTLALFGTPTSFTFAGGATTLGVGASSGTLTLNNPTIGTSVTGGTLALFNTGLTGILNLAGAAGTLNIGPGSNTATSVNLAGGSSATGCTVDGASGNLTCSGSIFTGATSGVQGWWNVANGSIFPINSTLDLLIGGQSSASANFRVTGASPFAGTTSTASVSGQTSFATLVVNNNGVGDIFTASASGATRFVINNQGAVGIGTVKPTLATALQINPFFSGTQIQDLVSITNIAGQEPTASGVNALQVNWLVKPGTTANTAAERIQVTNNNTATGGTATGLRIVSGGAGAQGLINSPTIGLYVDGLSGASVATTLQNAIQIGTNWDSSIYGEGDLRINAGGNIILATSAGSTKFAYGTNSPLSNFDVRGNFGSGTLSIASISGTTSFAALVIDQKGVGDLFTASDTGKTVFALKKNGQILDTAYLTCTLKTDATGLVTCGTDLTGSGSSSPFSELSGSIVANNTTEDFLLGGQSTISAKFRVVGNSPFAGTLPVASIGARTSFAALVIDNQGFGDLIAASSSAIGNNPGRTVFQLTAAGTVNASSYGDINNLNYFLDPAAASVSLKVAGDASASGNLSFDTGSVAHQINILDNGTLNFVTSPAGNAGATSRLFIQNNGNIGIGTSNPSEKLEVNVGSNTGDGIRVKGTSAPAIIINNGTNDQSELAAVTSSGQYSNFSSTNDLVLRADLGNAIITARNASGAILFGTGSSDTEKMRITSGGSVGIGTTSPLATFDVRPNTTNGGTIPVASLSGATSFATFVIDNSGVGDLFTASVSGGTRFTIKGNGQIIANAYSVPSGCTLKTDTTGLVTCGTDLTGAGGGTNWWNQLAGALSPVDINNDFLVGGTTTASAIFKFTGIQSTGHQTIASISGNLIVRPNNGFGGRIGIGFDNPQYDLHISQKSSLAVLVHGSSAVNNGNASFGLYSQRDIGEWSFAVKDSNGAFTFSDDLDGKVPFTLEKNSPTNTLYVNTVGTIGIGTSSPSATLDIRGNNSSIGGTIPVASISGATSFAALVVDQAVGGFGDIFTASAGGQTRFTIAQDGGLLIQGDTVAAVGFVGTGTPSQTNAYAVSNGTGDQGSIVPNASFESAISKVTFADGWVNSSTSTAAVTQDISSAVHGNASAKVTTTGVNQVAAFYSSCFPIIGATGGSYTLNYFQKASTANRATVRAYMNTYTSRSNCMTNTTPTTTVPSNTTAVTAAYAQVPASAAFTSANGISATATWGRINFWTAFTLSGESVNIDAVRLTPTALTNGLDYAENYPANPNNIAEAGDVVSVESGGLVAQVKPTNKKADDSVIGIVSTNPGQVLDNGSVPEPKVAVALSGRVPVKVSLANGPIHVGDILQSSDIPGVAVKAIQAGPSVAVADENFTSQSIMESYYQLSNGAWNKVFTCDVQNPTCIGVGRIVANIKMSYFDPAPMIASIQEIGLKDNNPNASFIIPHYYTLNDRLGNPITKISAFLELAVGNLKAGYINAQQISTNALSVASENLTINGQNIRAYIASIVSDTIDNLNGTYLSPIASVDQIHTNIISPLDNSSNISLDISNSKLTIRNGKTASSSAVASIDNAGNASFSGSLSVGKDASFGGTLRASRIIADSIEGLNIKSSTIAANYITNNNITNVYNSTGSSFPTLSSSPTSSYSGSSLFGGLFASNNNYINIATYSSQLAYVENFAASNAEVTNGLMVFGPTSLSDTSVVGQLSVNGSLILANNSINALGSDLNLQPLRQGGLSIMAGLIYVDTNGNIKIKGDATIGGTLYANIISPIAGNDLSVKLPYDENSTNNPSIKVKGASGSAVLLVNGLGDLIASGEATFGKFNISNLVSEALAVSPTEVVATGSAGTGIINPHQTQMTIDNKLVTGKSLIYITPTSATNNQVLFLLRQIPNKSFTVGVQNTSNIQIPFNWIIIN